MLEKKEKLLTIGQFAALHSINKKTLMWYDEVGLFKPARIKENGYRYYTHYQSSALETILMLRQMNVPIRDIQAFMENRSAAALKSLLKEKIAELDRTVLQLREIRKLLSDCHTDMRTVLSADLSEISIIEREARYLAKVPTTADASFEKEVELVIAEAGKYQLPHLYNASYGAMIPVESLYSGNIEAYTDLFLYISDPVTTQGLHLQPKGKYLRAFSKGSWDKLPARYESILEYARKHELQLTGYSYETGINEICVQTMEDYITLIEIPLAGK